MLGKAQIFWEGHKNLKKSPNFLTSLSTSVKKLGDFFKILWPSQNIWTLLTKTHLHTYVTTFFVHSTVSYVILKGFLESFRKKLKNFHSMYSKKSKKRYEITQSLALYKATWSLAAYAILHRLKSSQPEFLFLIQFWLWSLKAAIINWIL